MAVRADDAALVALELAGLLGLRATYEITVIDSALKLVASHLENRHAALISAKYLEYAEKHGTLRRSIAQELITIDEQVAP